jgi:hypothetical protein
MCGQEHKSIEYIQGGSCFLVYLYVDELYFKGVLYNNEM